MPPLALWLIVPVKPLGEGKSRLTPLLSAPERKDLSHQLLLHTLQTAARVTELAGIAVISRDRDVLASARQRGALAILEASDRSIYENDGTVDAQLNRALDQARAEVVARGAEAILILPTDLPLITTGAIRRFCTLGLEQKRGVVVARSRDGGTNALFLAPPTIIDFAYGPHSYRRHVARARSAGVPVQEVRSDMLAFDLDFPADLVHLAQQYSPG